MTNFTDIIRWQARYSFLQGSHDLATHETKDEWIHWENQKRLSWPRWVGTFPMWDNIAAFQVSWTVRCLLQNESFIFTKNTLFSKIKLYYNWSALYNIVCLGVVAAENRLTRVRGAAMEVGGGDLRPQWKDERKPVVATPDDESVGTYQVEGLAAPSVNPMIVFIFVYIYFFFYGEMPHSRSVVNHCYLLRSYIYIYLLQLPYIFSLWLIPSCGLSLGSFTLTLRLSL